MGFWSFRDSNSHIARQLSDYYHFHQSKTWLLDQVIHMTEIEGFMRPGVSTSSEICVLLPCKIVRFFSPSHPSFLDIGLSAEQK